MVSIVHGFASGIADDPGAASAGKVLPSHWNASHTVTMAATQRVVGRNTSGSGAAEEVTITQLLDWAGGTEGMVLLRGASAWGGLAIGTSGQLLKSNGTTASWATQAGIVAWAKFNGTNASISNSHNVTSVTRNSAGNYTINFTTPLSSADYSTHVLTNLAMTSFIDTTTTPTTSLVRIQTNSGSTPTDTTLVNVAVFI